VEGMCLKERMGNAKKNTKQEVWKALLEQLCPLMTRTHLLSIMKFKRLLAHQLTKLPGRERTKKLPHLFFKISQTGRLGRGRLA